MPYFFGVFEIVAPCRELTWVLVLEFVPGLTVNDVNEPTSKADIHDFVHLHLRCLCTPSEILLAVTGALNVEKVGCDQSLGGPRPSSALKENAKLAWHGFKLLAKDVEAFFDGTPFKIPVAVLNKLIDSADAIIDNKESMAQLLLPIGERLELLSKQFRSKGRPTDIDPALKHFASIVGFLGYLL
ncbi:hypothetical protein B0H14DRAFT_2601525 [Mycena olivaceomarginata]|nr:hypothetical protein B0H14DRAFT_2601525 [Mycena olivaceomarginata]